jgi:hypothetical protein
MTSFTLEVDQIIRRYEDRGYEVRISTEQPCELQYRKGPDDPWLPIPRDDEEEQPK